MRLLGWEIRCECDTLNFTSRAALVCIKHLPMIEPTQSIIMNNHGGNLTAINVPDKRPTMKAIQNKVFTVFASAGS